MSGDVSAAIDALVALVGSTNLYSYKDDLAAARRDLEKAIAILERQGPPVPPTVEAAIEAYALAVRDAVLDPVKGGGVTYAYRGLRTAVDDLAIAGRAREAALTAEVERLRAEVEVERVGNVWRKMAGDATDLAQDIADEAFGPLETQGPIESLRAIERGIAGLNEDLAAARADAANARAVATEAIDDLSHGVDCDRRRDDDGVVRGCNCYLATLRAQLASPGPAKET